VATLAGLGAGGAVGGIVGALVGMGIPEYEAKRYEGAVKDGGSLLSVHCDTSEQIHTAKEALRDTGARDISSAGEAASNDKSGARGTYGNISDEDTVLEPVSDRVRGDGVVVDRDVEDREVIAGTSPTKKY
jgi:hypothetical protein